MDVLIIAHFITEFHKEGTSRFVYLANQLSEKHNVELITSSFDHIKKEQRSKQDYNLGFKVTMLKEPSYPRNVCLKRFYSHANFGFEVKKYLKQRKKPDVIYCAVPSLDCAYFAAKYAQENNVKFIIDIQDLWPEAYRMVFNIPLVSDIIFYPMAKKANYVYSVADVIVGVSETYCLRAKQVNKKNAECIPVFLGTKLSKFDKNIKENRVNRNDEKFVLGYCGTLGHSYDIKCVLDALIVLREKEYNNVCLWVMGDGPLKETFEKYALENDLDVHFYGRVPYEQMCGLLSSCDACINPITKGAAQSIINKHADYAASGLPVINTQEMAEYRNLVEKYKCGINCECSNHNDIANAIIYLITHQQDGKNMGENARRMAEELFDRTKSYEIIVEIFNEGIMYDK